MFPAGSIVIPDGLLPVVPSIADDAVRVRFVNLSPEIHPVHEVISSLACGELFQIPSLPVVLSQKSSEDWISPPSASPNVSCPVVNPVRVPPERELSFPLRVSIVPFRVFIVPLMVSIVPFIVDILPLRVVTSDTSRSILPCTFPNAVIIESVAVIAVPARGENHVRRVERTRVGVK